MRKKLKLEIWIKIFNIILKNNRAELQQILDQSNFSLSTVKRYLATMEEYNEIFVVRVEGEEFYLVNKEHPKFREDVRSIGIRIQIYFLISKDPGLHLSKIAEMLEISPALAEYHLLYLEQNEYIRGVKDDRGYYRRYYIKVSGVGTEDKKILNLLRQDLPLRIVLNIFQHRSLRHKDLLEIFDIAPSTLSYYLNKLRESDIVEVTLYGEDKGYTLKNEKEIIRLIRKYRLAKFVEGFTDTWKDLNL